MEGGTHRVVRLLRFGHIVLSEPAYFIIAVGLSSTVHFPHCAQKELILGQVSKAKYLDMPASSHKNNTQRIHGCYLQCSARHQRPLDTVV